MSDAFVWNGKRRVVGERLFRVATHVLISALIAFSGACRGREELPQHVLDARKPNVTASRYLSPPRSSDDRSATLLLFVHGVFGDTLGSWTRPNARSLPELILNRPEFAKRFDAFAFGFASSTIKPGSFRIPEAAAALAREVTFREFLSRYQGIVIVAHSMGGLVALEMLTTFPEIRAKVPLVVTYGTPYDGAQVGKLGELLNTPVVNDMLRRDDGNTFLQSLANRWREARNASATRVICAYETVPLPIVGLIVPSTSSSSLCDGATTAIAEDHIGLVKPDSTEHESVKVLTNALRTLAVVASKPPPVVRQVQEPEAILNGIAPQSISTASTTTEDRAGRQVGRGSATVLTPGTVVGPSGLSAQPTATKADYRFTLQECRREGSNVRCAVTVRNLGATRPFRIVPFSTRLVGERNVEFKPTDIAVAKSHREIRFAAGSEADVELVFAEVPQDVTYALRLTLQGVVSAGLYLADLDRIPIQ